MVEKKLVDNLIDEIKEKYWCKTEATNNEYNSLNILRKTDPFIRQDNKRETINLDFYFNGISLVINADNLYFDVDNSKTELPELHNLIDLLMKIEKLISDQQEIDSARKDINNARNNKN